jgi:hypothetical protein
MAIRLLLLVLQAEHLKEQKLTRMKTTGGFPHHGEYC